MAEKEYDLKFNYEDGYLHAVAVGDWISLDSSKRCWQQIADEVRKSNCRKILFEGRVVGHLSLIEYHQMGVAISEMGFRGCKLAYVDLTVTIYRNVLNFLLHAQNVALNRGITGQVFDDVNKAREWLMHEEAQLSAVSTGGKKGL